MKQNQPLSLSSGLSIDRLFKLYQSILEESSDAIMLMDENSNIVEANKACLNLLAYPREEFFNITNPLSFIRKEDQKKALHDFRYVKANGQLKDCEYRFINKEGLHVPVQVSYKTIAPEGFRKEYIILNIKDITKTIIQQRAIETARQKAEIADKLKTSFLANMSHEIRTPINAIVGFADLLSDPELEEEEKEEYISTIQTNGELLLKLINDIIDMAKIESGQLKITPIEFSINEMMEEVYLSARNTLTEMNKQQLLIDYTIDENMQSQLLKTDQFRLMQILNNLINNAIKFTEEGEIHFGCRLNSFGKVEFYVRDTGVGIPEDQLDSIFLRFAQVEQTMQYNIGGSGLGLSITKSLVNILGGNIKVESRMGKGSEFRFTIDSSIRKGETNKPKKINYNFQGKKALIVEDIESNYRLLQVLLEKVGIETIWALKGRQAISICKNSRDIDLVLMDINLPDMDGYQVTNQIKSIKPNLPVIAQTAYAMAGEREKSLAYGCDDYLAKPINPGKLYDKIARFVV